MDLKKMLQQTEGRYKQVKKTSVEARVPLRIATDDRPYENDIGRVGEEGTGRNPKREQSTSLKGTNGDLKGNKRPLKGTSESSKREQSTSLKGTNGDLKGNKRPAKRKSNELAQATENATECESQKRDSNGEQTRTVPFNKGERSLLKEDLFPIKRDSNGEQTRTVPFNKGERSLLKEDLFPIKRDSNGEQRPVELEALSGTKREQNRKRTASSQQLLILRYLIEKQEASGLNHTPMINRHQIAEHTDITSETVKTQLKRLCKKGLVRRVRGHRGRYAHGTIFCVEKDVCEIVKREQREFAKNGKIGVKREQIENLKGNNNRVQTDPSSSSSFKTTTTDRDLARELEQFSERLSLSELSIGASDLLDIWHRCSGMFGEDLAVMLESVEHAAFYARSEHAEGIKKPKAWVLSKLKAGYFAQPAGFESFEAKQIRLRMEARQQRLDELRQLRREELQQQFELWSLELTKEKRAVLLDGYPSDDPSSKLVQIALKDAFRTEHNISPEDF